ncbi:helicase-associated domain-containing protein [Paenibacillus sp. PL91]|uniref:helicase-associated domain-containing protein n=1 Tax=Paenibacillus sp. PL91 TaxID=2729538 RepID=UPI00145D7C61|nr:helicase-associated domain-containing protein [Paenibacillus sp. PL91]MBC9199686.1 helicase-associated domain-containing protein [Paenibacillus sp. PL91]
MRMQQLVDKLPEERLKSFMQASIWQPASQRELSWQEAAAKEETIQEAAALLSPYAALVLKEMLRFFCAAPVEGERLIKQLRRNTDLSGAECQIGIAELEEAGILFSVTKVWGESLYFVPVDSFASWQRALFPCKPMSITAEDREWLMNGVIRPYCRPFGRQLLSALSALGRSGLALTINGTLPKKTVNKLLQAVDIDESHLKSFDLKWSYSDVYPLKAAFILEAASALGLFEAVDGSFQWNDEVLSRWMSLEETERERQLLSWCLALLLPAGGWSAHLAAAVTALQAGEWYLVSELDNQLSEAGLLEVGDAESVEGSLVPCWYGLLYSLGWLELVDSYRSDVKELFFRWKSIAPISGVNEQPYSADHPFIAVQPNGEIIVEPACPFWIRWELELLAERKSDELITIYRLEAASISRALEYGRTKASIQSFLQQSSGGISLPLAALALLEEWTSRACRTTFAEVALLRCDNEAMAAVVENSPAISPLLVQKLGSLDFIVDRAQINAIRGLLQKAGYPARKAVQSDAQNENSSYPIVRPFNEQAFEELSTSKHGRPVPSYIYEAFPLQHFELNEQAARKKLESMAELDRVPAMWTKQLRAYHYSTRKELIEQALQWQMPVQLRMERELRSFIPEKLEQQDDSWAVVGLLRDEPERLMIRLTPDMWEEMRLVVPGQGTPI